MKRAALCIVFAVAVLPLLSANGQIHGMPVAEMPGMKPGGAVGVTPCILMSDDTSMYGAHLGYDISECLMLFVDIGSYKTEHAPAETMGQLGMGYAVPLDLPVDIALRATVIPYVASYEYYIEFTVGVFASRRFGTSGKWTVYAGAGAVYQEWELELALSPEQAAMTGQDTYVDIGDQTDPLATVGASCVVSDKTSVFVEASYVSDLVAGLGLRFGF